MNSLVLLKGKPGNMRKIYAFILLAIALQGLMAQKASLLFFGDIMGHGGQITSAQQADGSYDYEPTLKYIEPSFRSADIVVGNLEVTLAGPPFTGYPAFSSPDALALAYKNAGVNFLVTANNHSYDRGQKGMERTIDVMERMYFNYTGTFKDSTDFSNNNPKLVEINGIRLAILNYTYGTNGIAVRQPNIVNHIVREEIADHIVTSRNLNPDLIVVCIHWGDEYALQPNASQRSTAEFLFDQGVDIIIGSHPHVVQPMHMTEDENGKRRILVYSLGNFVSNQRNEYTDGGVMVRVEIEKEGCTAKVINAEYLLTWVYTPVENGKKNYYVLPASLYSKIGLPEHLRDAQGGMYSYLNKARGVMKSNTGIQEITEEWPLK